MSRLDLDTYLSNIDSGEPGFVNPEFFNYFENNLQELQKTARGEFEDDEFDEEPKQMPAGYGSW